MARSAGSARAKASAGPEQSIQPVPSRQACGDMKTGAWRNATLRPVQPFARAAVPAGETVVWSTTRASGPSAGTTSASRASTAASSATQMWTRSAPATAAAGVAATWAPSASSGRVRAAVRFHATTATPRRSIASTIPAPMSPVPRNATLAMRPPVGRGGGAPAPRGTRLPWVHAWPARPP